MVLLFAAASCDSSLLFVKGGVPRFTLSPWARGQRTKFAAVCFFRSAMRRLLSRYARKGTPTSGLAVKMQLRRALDRADGAQARERRCSHRHSGPQGRGGRDPNRRDGARLGAYLSRAGWRATAERWPPAGIARERETCGAGARPRHVSATPPFSAPPAYGELQRSCSPGRGFRIRPPALPGGQPRPTSPEQIPVYPNPWIHDTASGARPGPSCLT